MSTKRFITLLCDRCSLEFRAFGWVSKIGVRPVTTRDVVKAANKEGWVRVNAGDNPSGGSKRFDFCPDPVCQAAAKDVPRRLSAIKRAEVQVAKKQERLAKLKEG